MANYGGYNFNVRRTKPTSFNTPSLIRLDGFRSAAAPATKGGFKFEPLFKPRVKNQAWRDIEKATGMQFPSYEAAFQYLISKKTGKDNGKSVGGFLGGLFHDAVDTVVGLGPGLVAGNVAIAKDLWGAAHGDLNFNNTVDIGKAVVKNYKQTYSPAFHGDFGQLWDNIYAHPLGPILDAATLVTAGAGGSVRAAGLVAKGSRLAKLGEAEYLSARSPMAIRAGESADAMNSMVFKRTSRNPIIRGRQKLAYKALSSSKLPREWGVKFEERKFTQAKVRFNRKNTETRRYASTDHEHAPAILGYEAAVKRAAGFKNMTPHEWAAANLLGLVGSGMHPTEVVKLLAERGSEAGFGELPRDFVKLATDEKTTSLFEQAVRDHAAGRENKILTLHNMMDEVGVVNARHKGISADVAEVRRYSTRAHLETTQHERGIIHDLVLERNPELASAEHANQLSRITDNAVTRAWMVAKNRGQSVGEMLVEIGNRPPKFRDALLNEIYVPNDPALVAAGKASLNAAPVNPVVRGLEGEIKPLYVPHKTGLDSKFGGTFGVSNGTGQLVHHNDNVVLLMGRIAIGEDLLGPEFARTLRLRHAQDVYQSMIESGVLVEAKDFSQMISNGYVYVKKIDKGKDGFLTKHHQEQLNHLFEQVDESGVRQGIDNFFTGNDAHAVVTGAEEALTEGGKYVMIRKGLRDQLTQEYHAAGVITRRFVEKPTTLWKYVVLGLSPRNIVTNVVGNTLMAALLANGPVGGMRIIAHSAIKSMGPEAFVEALTFKGKLGVSDRFVQRYFPEHWQASFSHGELDLHGKAQAAAFAYRATHRNEIALRQGLMMELIRSEPEIRALYNRVEGSGYTRNSWEAAAETAFNRNPRLRDALSERVDDALGNYRDFTNRERALRRFMPFYSWYRHAARTGRAMMDRPATLAAGYQIGQYGQQLTQEAYGDVPEFLKAFAPLGSRMVRNADGSETKMVAGVNTAGLNPFHALVEMARAGKALTAGDPIGATGQVSSFLSPGITAGIEELTGKSLLTGAPSKTPQVIPGQPGGLIPGFLARLVAGTPQYRLGDSMVNPPSQPSGLDALTPTGRLKKTPMPTLSKGARTQVWNFLGFPMKDVNVSQAQEWKKQIDQKGEFHLPKPRKKKRKKTSLPSFNFGGG